MAITKTEIFIASRFDEFAELRELLAKRINQFPVFPLQAVDLNDGVAAGTPPLGKCIAAVKRAEIMILMVGDTYGGTPPGEQNSFTHLEYRAALADSSQTVVLTYFISRNNVQNKFHGYSNDPKLAAWQKEIMEIHTPAFLDASEDPKILCQVIFDGAYKALYDARTSAVQQQMDMSSVSEDLDPNDEDLADAPSAGDDSLGLSHSDMERLDDAFHGDDKSIFDTGDGYLDNTSEILQRPSEMAAREQKREAFKALELGNRFIAINHFRKAHEIRPLDFPTTYWLARLLVSSGKISDCREAVRYSLLAAKMASHDQRPVKAAASLIIASKAAAQNEDHEEALEYARKAVEETPWLATARLELSCQLAGAGQAEDALKELRRAIARMPQIILKANREPALLKLGKRYQEFKKALRDSLLKDISIIYKDELNARQKLAPEDADKSMQTLQAQYSRLQSKPLLNLYFEGKSAAHRQLRYLEQQASQLYSFDDAAINNYYSSKLKEHEESLSDAQWNMRQAVSDRNSATFRLIAWSVLVVALSVFAVKLASIFSLFLGLGAVLFVGFAYASIKQLTAANQRIDKCKQITSNDAAVKSSISENASKFRKQAEDKVHHLCSAIIAFEKHVMQNQFFSVGRSIKGARPGQVVAIDASLQTDVLKNAEVDDSIVPSTLASHASDLTTTHDGRIRLYRLVDYRNNRPILSRWSVYFGVWSDQAEDGTGSEDDEYLSDRSMYFDYEEDGFIHVTCPECDKGSKISNNKAIRADYGYKMKGSGKCACGFNFDGIIYTTDGYENGNDMVQSRSW